MVPVTFIVLYCTFTMTRSSYYLSCFHSISFYLCHVHGHVTSHGTHDFIVFCYRKGEFKDRGLYDLLIAYFDCLFKITV